MICYFMRVGTTKTGRGLYRLSDGKGNPFGRRFTIKKGRVSRRRSGAPR